MSWGFVVSSFLFPPPLPLTLSTGFETNKRKQTENPSQSFYGSHEKILIQSWFLGPLFMLFFFLQNVHLKFFGIIYAYLMW